MVEATSGTYATVAAEDLGMNTAMVASVTFAEILAGKSAAELELVASATLTILTGFLHLAQAKVVTVLLKHNLECLPPYIQTRLVLTATLSSTEATDTMHRSEDVFIAKKTEGKNTKNGQEAQVAAAQHSLLRVIPPILHPIPIQTLATTIVADTAVRSRSSGIVQ